MKLIDYKKDYEKLDIKKNLIGKEALKAVEENGYALQYVQDQTEEICLKAMEQNGLALQYVLDQTEEICLKAMEQNGLALQYVDERFFKTPDNMIDVDGKLISVDTIKSALNEYFKLI